MKIDGAIPATDPSFSSALGTIEIQSANREVIQAVHAINASAKLGDSNELVFSLDRQTRRAVIRLVSRTTNEVVLQIPTEQVLRLAENLKGPGY